MSRFNNIPTVVYRILSFTMGQPHFSRVDDSEEGVCTVAPPFHHLEKVSQLRLTRNPVAHISSSPLLFRGDPP